MRHKQEDQGQDKLPSARLIKNRTLMLLRRYRQRTRNIRAGLNTRAFHLSCQPSYSSGVTTGGGVIPAIKSLKTDAMMVNWTEYANEKSGSSIRFGRCREISVNQKEDSPLHLNWCPPLRPWPNPAPNHHNGSRA